MRIELANCTNVLLSELKYPKVTQKRIAKTYALALGSSERTDWARVNRAIIERWSISGLKRIKEMAWSGKCFDDILPASEKG